MKNGKERRLYRISMVITAMMFIGIFCPWLVYRNKTYTIIGFYCAVKNAGGISSFAGSYSFIYPAVITLTVPFAAGIVAGIKFLIQAFRGRIGIISWTVYSLEWVYMALYFSFEGYQPTIFAIGGPVLALADFLVNRFMEEYRLLTRKNRELREKERREKKERKERLSFPGKYSCVLFLRHPALRRARQCRRQNLHLIPRQLPRAAYEARPQTTTGKSRCRLFVRSKIIRLAYR